MSKKIMVCWGSLIQKENHDPIKTWWLLRVIQREKIAHWTTVTEGYRNKQTIKNNLTFTQRVKGNIKIKWSAWYLEKIK